MEEIAETNRAAGMEEKRLDTSSEEWRAECEARLVASWKPDRIRAYLELVEKARGVEAAQKLRLAARKLYGQVKNSQALPATS